MPRASETRTRDQLKDEIAAIRLELADLYVRLSRIDDPLVREYAGMAMGDTNKAIERLLGALREIYREESR